MFKSPFFKSVVLFSAISFFASCSKNKGKEEEAPALETKTFSNLYAPQTAGPGSSVGGEFTKFSFSQHAIVKNEAWDIAFRGTAIIVNGGVAIGLTDEPARTGSAAACIVTNTLEALKNVPDASTFKQDGANSYAIPTGSGAGWYTYNSTTHIISPTPGKVLVIKTHDGKYAKMEILSYYKDAPAAPNLNSDARYYTFKCVYQAVGNTF